MDPSNLPSSTPIPTPLTPGAMSSPASIVTSPYHSNASSPSVSVAKTHTINVPEYIKQVQQKIANLGQGQHTPAQKQELHKLQTTLVKLHQAHQEMQAGMKPDLSSTLLHLSSSSSRPAAAASVDGKVLDKRRLGELVKEVDPLEQLDDDVEEVLMQIADDFIDSVVNSSCQIAKHRKANTVEVKDVQLHLERNWNMWIPGFGSDDLRPYKKQATTEAHKQRLALIKKTMKKY